MAIVMDEFHGIDSTTNTVVTISEFIKETTGTPASGIGAGIALGAENSNGDATHAMQLQGYLTTVTDGAEYGEALLKVMYNGSQKTVAKFTGLSTGSVIFYDTPLVLDTTVAGTGACWFICGPAGTNRHWGRMFTGNNQTTGKRWDMYANDTAESGSNAGTDFRLGAYADDGTWIDDPIQIPRVAGGAFTTPRPIVSTSTIKASSSSVGDITMGLQTTNVHTIEQYSGDTAAGAFIAIKGRGTKSSPSTVQAFDGLFFLGARNYAESSTNICAIRMLAGETYSGSGRGTYFNVETCINGSTSRTERLGTDPVTGHFFVKQGGSTDRAHVGGVVYENNTAVGNAGTGEDDLMSASVAASTLGTNGYSLRSVMTFSTAANGNNKTFKIKYGATTLWDSGAVAANAQMVWADIHIYRTGAATQKAIVKISTSGGFTATVVKTTPAETLSGAVTLKATGEATSDNDAVQESMIVWWEPVNT